MIKAQKNLIVLISISTKKNQDARPIEYSKRILCQMFPEKRMNKN